MQYDLLYNPISYLKGMIYLTNKIEKIIKIINQSKTRSIDGIKNGTNNGRQTR